MLIQTEKNSLLSEVFVSNLQTTSGSKRLIADRLTHRLFKFSTLIGNSEKKKLNKSQKQPWTRFTWELVIIIAYTKVSLLSFMRNMSIYSLRFKRETHTNSLQRYCTKVYTVKAERAIQITHTHTHNSPHTQALNINAACRCCISANHTHIQQKESRETSKIHNQRHLKLISGS